MRKLSILQILFFSLCMTGMGKTLFAQVEPGVYEIIARHSGKCLDVPNSSQNNGVGIIQYTRNNTTNQKWKIYEGPSGYYTLRALHSGKSLDVPGSSTSNGVQTIQFTSYFTTNQQWKLTDLGNGYFEIKNHNSGKCLDVAHSSTLNEAPVVQYTPYRTTNQQWQLRRISSISEEIIGTNGDDKIYFGYDKARNCLKVVVNNAVSYYSLTGYSFTIDGGDGNDVIKAFSNEEKDGYKFDSFNYINYTKYILKGGNGNDEITGTIQRDYLYGNAGTDLIIGNPGNDYIYGGDGNDVIYGYYGNDYIYGGAGNDYLFGDQGTDRLYGEDDNDVLVGGKYDYLIGGEGYDARHCRSNVNAIAEYDAQIEYNDFPCNCSDPYNRVDVEYVSSRDPYNDWVYKYHFKMVDGVLIKKTFYTTSSLDKMNYEISLGATMLMHDGEPLHVVHKQYRNTCGPSSLSMIMEYMGMADRDKTAQFYSNLDYSVPYFIFNNSTLYSNYVDVGYYLSTEYIMCEGYHWKYHHGYSMDNYLIAEKWLDKTSSEVPARYFNIDYPMGDITINSSGVAEGDVLNWQYWGPAVGMSNYAPEKELAYIANKYSEGNEDAMPYFLSNFDNLEHIKSTIKGFIDNGLPLLAGVNNGGHFRVIMGYRMVGSSMYIYLADPVDGWGLNPYYCKSMRWEKMLLTDYVTRSGLINMIMVYNQSNTNNGCASSGWARAIDNNFSANLLCDNVTYSLKSTEGLTYENNNVPLGEDEAILSFDNTTSLSAFPNPSDGLMSLKFILTKKQSVRLEIYDVNGSLVDVLIDNTQMEKGVHEVEFDGLNLNRGVYFCTLKGDSNQTIKLVITD